MVTTRPALGSVLVYAVACAMAGLALAGCSSRETKKQRFLESGDRYLERAQYAAAVIEYKNAVRLDPAFGPAYRGLARAHEQIGDAAATLAAYIRAADLLPHDSEIQLATGTYLLAAGRFDEAKARAEAVLARNNREVRAYVIAGNALAGLKDFDEAIAQIEEALRLEPLRGATHTNLAMLEVARGRLEAAEQAFTRAVALDPRWVPGHLALANHFWSTKRLDQAERAFRAALDLEPSNPLTNRALATFYVSTGQAARAEAHAAVLSASNAAPFALADFYMFHRRPAEAISELVRLREASRTATEATRRLAVAYAATGRLEDARREIEELLRQDRKDADTLVLKAQLLSRDGKHEEAFQELQRAAAAAPESARVQLALGRAYVRRADIDQARQAFNEVLRLNSRAGEARIELARLDLAEGRTSRAVQLAKDAVRGEPASIEAQLMLTRSLIAAKDVGAARRLLEPLLLSHPNVAAAHVQMGLALATAGDHSSAREAFERALAIDGRSVEALEGLLALDAASGANAAARARIDAALARHPDDAELLLVAAKTSATVKDWTGAERALRRALELDRNLLSGYTLLGQLYLLQDRLADARREFEALASRGPKPVSALTMTGMIALMQGEHERARHDFERVVSMEPRAAIAANNLAWLYAERGEHLDRALELAHLAVQELPRTAEVRDTFGWVQYKRGMADEAAAAFREALRLAGDRGEFHYHLGLAHALAGRDDEAADSMRRALTLAGATAPAWADDARRYTNDRALTSAQ